MFRNWSTSLTAAANQGSGGDDAAKKASTMSPTLRSDIYSSIDQAKLWLIAGGGMGAGAGDGVSYKPLLTTIQKHFPDTKLGVVIGSTVTMVEQEVAVIVGGITNMILEMSRWEGMAMAGGMALRTWVDALVDAYGKIESTAGKTGPGDSRGRKGAVAKGITRGVNQYTDASLVTSCKEFTTKIQIIASLKSVSSRIYGAGSEEARQGEALWSSKLI